MALGRRQRQRLLCSGAGGGADQAVDQAAFAAGELAHFAQPVAQRDQTGDRALGVCGGVHGAPQAHHRVDLRGGGGEPGGGRGRRRGLASQCPVGLQAQASQRGPCPRNRLGVGAGHVLQGRVERRFRPPARGHRLGPTGRRGA